tara:strand:- start:1434 stop:2048 length:615 start_codon:yes stop_codon:yes gene_type:complete
MIWLLVCMLGEAIGIAGIATAYVATDSGSLPYTATILIAGGVEGLALGAFQALVLRGRVRGFSSTGWIVATLGVALLAYGASLAFGAGAPSAPLAPAAADAATAAPPLFLTLPAAGAVGLVLGALMGAAQAMFGRLHHVPVMRWSLASGLGWALAMVVITAAASSFVPQTLGAAALIGGLTGAAAGLLLGLATLFALPRQSSFF